MSDITKEKVKHDNIGSVLAIPIKFGHGQERIVELPLGTPIAKILDLLSKELGCDVSELTLSREGEGEDDVVTGSVKLSHDYPHKKRHHIHRVGEIDVTLYYQDAVRKLKFKRRQTVDDVLAEAVKIFRIDPQMASEFVLVRHGQKEEIPGAEHIGHVAGRECELALDVVRGEIANGGVA